MTVKRNLKFTCRILAMVLVASMLMQDAAMALPAGVASIQRPKSAASNPYQIPRSVALVGDFYVGKSGNTGPMVILVEDAHTNPSGQMNLAQTLKAVLSEHQLSVVFTEGADRDVSLSDLRARGTGATRAEAALPFVRKGELKGSEYLELTAQKDFSIIGVEDKVLYDRAVTLYAKAARVRGKLRPALDRIDTAVNSVSAKLLNPRLAEFHAATLAYAKDELLSSEYFSMLTVRAIEVGVSQADLKQLEGLERVRKLEKKIDFAQASIAWSEAVTELPPADRASLDAAPIGVARHGNLEEMISAGARLSKVMGARKVSADLRRYLKYLNAMEKLDPHALLSEADRIEQLVEEQLTLLPAEKRVLRIERSVRFLRAMSDLTLTPQGYEYLISAGKDADLEYIAGFLNRQIMDLKIPTERAILLEDVRLSDLEAARDFYQGAFERDEAFVQSLLKAARVRSVRQAILITGGFHTPHLTQLLRDRGIPYRVLTPQVYEETDRVRYERLLLANAPKSDAVHMTASALITPYAAETPGVRRALEEAFGALAVEIEAQTQLSAASALVDGARMANADPQNDRIVTKKIRRLWDLVKSRRDLGMLESRSAVYVMGALHHERNYSKRLTDAVGPLIDAISQEEASPTPYEASLRHAHALADMLGSSQGLNAGIPRMLRRHRIPLFYTDTPLELPELTKGQTYYDALRPEQRLNARLRYATSAALTLSGICLGLGFWSLLMAIPAVSEWASIWLTKNNRYARTSPWIRGLAVFGRVSITTNYRSALAAEKTARTAEKLRVELGRRPVVWIEYGASHGDILIYLKFPLIRKLMIAAYARLNRYLGIPILREYDGVGRLEYVPGPGPDERWRYTFPDGTSTILGGRDHSPNGARMAEGVDRFIELLDVLKAAEGSVNDAVRIEAASAALFGGRVIFEAPDGRGQWKHWDFNFERGTLKDGTKPFLSKEFEQIFDHLGIRLENARLLWEDPALQNPYFQTMFGIPGGMEGRLVRAAKAGGLKPGTAAEILDPVSVFRPKLSAQIGAVPRAFEAIRVIHNAALGPAKGGIRVMSSGLLTGDDDFMKRFEFLRDKKNFSIKELRYFMSRWIFQETSALAPGMTLKASAAGLPYGGAKGIMNVADVVPGLNGLPVLKDLTFGMTKEEADLARKRAFRRFIGSLYSAKLIGPWKDVPAPDMGSSSTDMDVLADEYLEFYIDDLIGEVGLEDARVLNGIKDEAKADRHKSGLTWSAKAAYLKAVNKYLKKARNEKRRPVRGSILRKLAHAVATVTAKTTALGGSEFRQASTGVGVHYVLKEVLRAEGRGLSVAGLTAKLEGFGGVGIPAAHEALRDGVKLTAVRDLSGAIMKSDGLTEADLDVLERLKKDPGGFAALGSKGLVIAGAEYHAPGKDSDRIFMSHPSNIYYACAKENSVTADSASYVAADIIVEGANGAVASSAYKKLARRGVLVIPDTLANAGGVIVSYFEWVQNITNRRWTAAQVEARMKRFLNRSVRSADAVRRELGIKDWRLASDIAALRRIEAALEAPAGARMAEAGAPLETSMSFFDVDQAGQLKVVDRDPDGGWLAHAPTQTYYYYGEDAKRFLRTHRKFPLETQVINALGKGPIRLRVNGVERTTLDEPGLMILQELSGSEQDIEFEAVEGVDVVIQMRAQPPRWYMRFSAPHHRFEEIRREIGGFDASGLQNPDWADKYGITILKAAERVNPWNKQDRSFWLSSSVLRGSSGAGSPIIAVSSVSNPETAANLNYTQLYSGEILHSHPPIPHRSWLALPDGIPDEDFESGSVGLRELYSVVQGEMGLLVEVGGRPQLIVLKPGDVFATAPHVVHGIIKVNSPFTSVVTQIPGTFQYGVAFKKTEQHDGREVWMGDWTRRYPALNGDELKHAVDERMRAGVGGIFPLGARMAEWESGSYNGMILALSALDTAAEVPVDPARPLVLEDGFEKAELLLPSMAERGIRTLYLYGTADIGSSSGSEHDSFSGGVHTVPDAGGHVVWSKDGRVATFVRDYTVRREARPDGRVLDDSPGNMFSVMSLKDIHPGMGHAGDHQEQLRQKLKHLTEKAESLGIKVILDFIPWRSPEAVNETNYKSFFHRELSDAENQEYRALGTSEPAQREWIKQLLVRDRTGSAAVRIRENGAERVILVRRFNFYGLDSGDQVIMNPYHPDTHRYYVDSLKAMVDAGAGGVRVDLGYLLLPQHIRRYFDEMDRTLKAQGRSMKSWLRETDADIRDGESFNAWWTRRNAGSLPWRQILGEVGSYAAEQGKRFNFIIEAYDQNDRNELRALGVDGSYKKALFDALRQVMIDPDASIRDLVSEVFWVIDEKTSAVVFPSNFDQLSLLKMGGTTPAVQMLMASLAAVQVPVIQDLREWSGQEGHVVKVPGGSNSPDDKDFHPFASDPEIALRVRSPRTWQVEALTSSSWTFMQQQIQKVTGGARAEDIRILNNSNRDNRYLTLMWRANGRWFLSVSDFRPGFGAEGNDDLLRVEVPSFTWLRGFDPALLTAPRAVIGEEKILNMTVGSWTADHIAGAATWNIRMKPFGDGYSGDHTCFLDLGPAAQVPVRRLPAKLDQVLLEPHLYEREREFMDILASDQPREFKRDTLFVALLDQHHLLRAIAANTAAYRYRGSEQVVLTPNEMLGFIRHPLSVLNRFEEKRHSWPGIGGYFDPVRARRNGRYAVLHTLKHLKMAADAQALSVDAAASAAGALDLLRQRFLKDAAHWTPGSEARLKKQIQAEIDEAMRGGTNPDQEVSIGRSPRMSELRFFRMIVVRSEAVRVSLKPEARDIFYWLLDAVRTLVPDVPGDPAADVIYRGKTLPARARSGRGFHGARMTATGAYQQFYDMIRAENKDRVDITEGDLGRSRLFITPEGRMRSFEERRANGVLGVTEVYFVPPGGTRTKMEAFQNELRAKFGDKLLPVDADKLHFTTQGLEELAGHAGLETIDPNSPPFSHVAELAKGIRTSAVDLRVSGVNWSPSIGIFWELQPYLDPAENAVDPIMERRAAWRLSQPRPPHMTAAYFAKPFSAAELSELRTMIARYNALPEPFEDIRVDELKVIGYEDFSFNAGYKEIATVHLGARLAEGSETAVLKQFLSEVMEANPVATRTHLAIESGVGNLAVFRVWRQGHEVWYALKGQAGRIRIEPATPAVMSARTARVPQIDTTIGPDEDRRLMPADAVALDAALGEDILKSVHRFTGAEAGQRPILANVELDDKDLIECTGNSGDLEYQDRIRQNLKRLQARIRESGFGRLLFNGDLDALPGAPTTRLYQKDNTGYADAAAPGTIRWAYTQGTDEILPVLSSTILSALIAAVPAEGAESYLEALTPFYQRLTGSAENLTPALIEEARSDPGRLAPIKPLTLRSYLDAVIYIQELARKSAASAA